MKNLETKCKSFMEPILDRFGAFLDRYEYCVLFMVMLAVLIMFSGALYAVVEVIFL